MSQSPEQVRETLLQSARKAGERYLHVRGVDLEAALEATAEEAHERSPGAKAKSEPKGRTH